MIDFTDIKGFEGLYLINKDGVIYSKLTNKYLKERVHHQGYLRVYLYKDRKVHRKLIHRLVAETFIGNPNNLPVVNHIDGNVKNNNVDNLEWVTDRENATHSKMKRYTNLHGATYSKQIKRWRSQLWFNGTFISLGTYKTEYEAHCAYLKGIEKFGISNKYINTPPPDRR